MAKMGRPLEPNARRKTITVRLSDDMLDRLKEYAERYQLTMTDVVLQSLDRTLQTKK